MGQKQPVALKIGERRLLPKTRIPRNRRTANQFIKIPARRFTTHRTILHGSIEVVLRTDRRGCIDQQDANVNRAKAGGEFEALDSLSNMLWVGWIAASIASNHFQRGTEWHGNELLASN